jgi:hypothetical protein
MRRVLQLLQRDSVVEWHLEWCTRVYPKVSGPSYNEIYAYNNKRSLSSNTKGYGGKTN